MILYDPHLPVSLSAYGIQIPLLDSRTKRTFEALRNCPAVGPVPQWHRSRIYSTVTRNDLLRVHSAAYVNGLYAGARRLEDAIVATYELIDADGAYHRYDPNTATRPLGDLFNRIVHYAAGTVQCAELALSHGFCFYFSGGMHHAHADHGSGFCLINDIVIAARKLQFEKGLERVWVIDTDAHKGDGTAAITVDDETISTLSIHMAHGWPLDSPRRLPGGEPNPVFIPSDIDIPVDAGEEPVYLERLSKGLSALDRLGPADLAIVVSGADPFAGDALPSTAGLRLSLDQMRSRDRMVYRFLKERAIPAAYMMAGGYGDAVWKVYAQFLSWALPQESPPR